MGGGGERRRQGCKGSRQSQSCLQSGEWCDKGLSGLRSRGPPFKPPFRHNKGASQMANCIQNCLGKVRKRFLPQSGRGDRVLVHRQHDDVCLQRLPHAEPSTQMADASTKASMLFCTLANASLQFPGTQPCGGGNAGIGCAAAFRHRMYDVPSCATLWSSSAINKVSAMWQTFP